MLHMLRNNLVLTLGAFCMVLVGAVTAHLVAAQESIRLPLTQRDLSVLSDEVLQPNGMVWSDGRLYVLCSGSWTIYELDDASGVENTFLWGVRDAYSLYAEHDDEGVLHLWMPDFKGQRLVHASREGLEEVATDLTAPWGIAPLDETAFLVSDLRDGVIERIGRDGTRETFVEGFAAPTGIARDGDALYIANFGSTQRGIEWVDLLDIESGAQPLVGGLSNVTGMQLGADGRLYFAYTQGRRGVVGRVDPAQCRATGGCAAEQVELVLVSDLRPPLAGLTITPDGRLYLHKRYSPEIYWAQIPSFQS